MLLTQFQNVGRDLFNRGLVTYHGGNLSLRINDKILITRRDGMLGNMSEQDLVETGIERNERDTPRASGELTIHRLIYKNTPALAVIHAHPPYTVALSLILDEIIPQDMEGKRLLRRLSVIDPELPVKNMSSFENSITEALSENTIVIIKGHGTYATGQLLEDAYHRTTVLEESCHILCILRSMGVYPQHI